MAEIAWTPPGSYLGLGTILLPRQPQQALSPQEYVLALSSRIDRLVRRERKERAKELLRVAGDVEGLEVGDNLASAGELLAENSQWLLERAAYPPKPVPAPLEHDPAALRHLKEETLEGFLSILYRDS